MGSCCLLGSCSSRLLERMGKALTGALCESQRLCGGSKMWYGSLCDRCGRVLLRNWRFGIAVRYADLSAQRPF
jgi:hypothetical protein